MNQNDNGKNKTRVRYSLKDGEVRSEGASTGSSGPRKSAESTTNGPSTATKKQLLKIIAELEKQPNDRVRILGDIGISTVGVGLGSAAAGTAAGLAGATTIPLVTVGAKAVFGAILVAPTPVGWVIGAGAAGGALAYGVTRLVRNGAMSEGRKKELLQVYQDKLRAIETKERAKSVTDNDRTQFIISLRELIERQTIAPDRAAQLIKAVEQGSIPISDAYSLISDLLKC